MCPCHRAVANTPPKWFAASVSLRRAMLPSSSFERFGLWGEYFSRLLRVHFSLRPDDLLTILKMALSVDERFGFPFLLYPSYEVLTFTSEGLPPTEPISLLFFSWMYRSSIARPTNAPVYASTDISRRRPQDSRSGWSRLLLSRRDSSSPTTCRFIPALSGLPVIRPQQLHRCEGLRLRSIILQLFLQ